MTSNKNKRRKQFQKVNSKLSGLGVIHREVIYGTAWFDAYDLFQYRLLLPQKDNAPWNFMSDCTIDWSDGTHWHLAFVDDISQFWRLIKNAQSIDELHAIIATEHAVRKALEK